MKAAVARVGALQRSRLISGFVMNCFQAPQLFVLLQVALEFFEFFFDGHILREP